MARPTRGCASHLVLCYNIIRGRRRFSENITFGAEDDILAIQMLRQECGVSSEKIRQRADVRDVVACHASLVLTRKGYDLRLVCLCDASSASRLVRFDRRHAMSGRDRKLEAKTRRSV